MNLVQTYKSAYKVQFKLRNLSDKIVFFNTLAEAKEYRSSLYEVYKFENFEFAPKLVMLSSNKRYDFINSNYGIDRWV